MGKEKNLKVILTVGPPGSGKTTWAKEKVRMWENYARVNRDDFRMMLKDTNTCENKIEAMITDLTRMAIIQCLKRKQNVIVDNPHVKKEDIEQVVEWVHELADVEFQIFNLSLKKCLERNAARDRKVPEGALEKMYENYKIVIDSFVFQNITKARHRSFIKVDFKTEKPNAVIFDIDGTLAHMTGRDPYDEENVENDELNDIVAEQVKFHADKNRHIIIVSGRSEECRKATEYWLLFNGIEYDTLYMRAKDDFRKDNIIKEEIYYTKIKDTYNVLCCYDDRIDVCHRWNSMGIFVFNVNQGLVDF